MGTFVTLNIDGQEVSVPKGTTVIQAASRAHIDIPHLCYLEGLKSTGACRMCLVEIEGEKGLVVSCARKVREGMVARTRTERVLEARRFVLELIWSIHPGDCTTCEKSGTCELQKYTYELGIEKRRFPLIREAEYPIDTTNPLIERDLNLCILCGRCVRICQTQGNYVLDFVKRGIATTVTTPFDKPLQESGCNFCGSCISVCPVGCLVEKDRKFRGREWEFETTQTICSLCGCDCDLLLDTMNNHIVRARPEKRDGYLCVRGKFGWDHVLSDERVRTPLIRKNGSLTECSWNEALEYVAERLQKIKETRGPDALGGLISVSCTNETLYVFAKFVRACLGTNNIDSSARLFGFPTLSDFIHSLGSAGVVSPMSEIEEADILLVLASDVMISYPAVGVKIKKALSRGAKVITIDPRKTKSASLSGLHLQPKAGSEADLLHDIISVLLKEGLYDKEFVARNCHNFEEFLQSFSEEKVEDRTGVSKEEVTEAARLYGEKGRKAIIVFSSEIGDPQLISMIADLLMLTGRVKGGAFPCLLLSNLRGVSQVGALAEFYPGYREVQDANMRKEFEKRWGVSLSTKAGLTAVEMIEAAGSSLFGLYIVGENPVVSFPDTTRMVKGISSLEFLVVQDIFLTETAQLADVVLPGISFVESSGTLTNAAGRTERLNKAIEPLTRPDWQVIAELSSRLGYPMEYKSEIEIMEEIEDVLSQGPRPPKYGFDLIKLDSGFESAREEPDSKYPYLLMAGSALFSLGDTLRTRRSKISFLESPGEGYVGISPEDAQSLGVTDGTDISISSRRGTISSTVKVQEDLPPGLVFMPTHSLGYNILTSSSLDSSTKSPRFRLWAVQIQAKRA